MFTVKRGKDHPRWLGGERVKRCQLCGKEFTQRPTEAISSFWKRKFCSHACGWIGQKYNSGPDHPNWTGGKRLRDSRHATWAQKVLIRDNATCQKCGAVGVQMHAHHIKPFIDNEALRYDISNGLTLCTKCHWKEHSALNDNGENSVNLLPGNAGDNTEPSRNGNIAEGVTTNGRAYRRWEGACEWCGNFISKQLSKMRIPKHHFCSKSCAARYRHVEFPRFNGSNSYMSTPPEREDIVCSA
jgi:5-methylcytosine-specific restriction endonuclease McrA